MNTSGEITQITPQEQLNSFVEKNRHENAKLTEKHSLMKWNFPLLHMSIVIGLGFSNKKTSHL